MAISDWEIRNLTHGKLSFNLSLPARCPVKMGPNESFRFRQKLGLDPARAKEVCASSPELLRLIARGHALSGPWPRPAVETPAAEAPVPERVKLRGEPAALHISAVEQRFLAGAGDSVPPLRDLDFSDPLLSGKDEEEMDTVELDVSLEPEAEASEETVSDRPDASWSLAEIVDWADKREIELVGNERRRKQHALRAIAGALSDGSA